MEHTTKNCTVMPLSPLCPLEASIFYMHNPFEVQFSGGTRLCSLRSASLTAGVQAVSPCWVLEINQSALVGCSSVCIDGALEKQDQKEKHSDRTDSLHLACGLLLMVYDHVIEKPMYSCCLPGSEVYSRNEPYVQ